MFYLIEVRSTAARSTASSYLTEWQLIDTINADRFNEPQLDNIKDALGFLKQSALDVFWFEYGEALEWALGRLNHDHETCRVAANRTLDEIARDNATAAKN